MQSCREGGGLGSARVSRVGEAVSGSRTFLTKGLKTKCVQRYESAEGKIRFGATPKQTRETRAPAGVEIWQRNLAVTNESVVECDARLLVRGQFLVSGSP
jgi:hypothetical protein